MTTIASSYISGLSSSNDLSDNTYGWNDLDFIADADIAQPFYRQIATSGYVKLWNTYMVAWGNISLASGATVTWTYPASFTFAPVVVASLYTDNNTTDRAAPKINADSGTSSTVLRNTNGATLTFMCIAVGAL